MGRKRESRTRTRRRIHGEKGIEDEEDQKDQGYLEGRRTVNSEPWSGWLETLTVPP